MITGELQSKVDSLWEIFWTGGLMNPLDAIYEQMAQLQSDDRRGDIYEYLLSKIATAGVNEQFRTLKHIIRMMVDMMETKADEIICDPACGASGFLAAASDYMKENRKVKVFFYRQNIEHDMNCGSGVKSDINTFVLVNETFT